MDLMSELVEIKPSSVKEYVEKLVWFDAMVEEYDSIVRNNVCKVVPRLANKSVVGSDGSIEKHKARFVAKRFSQVKGIDDEETFSPIVRYSSIRSILALSMQMGWKIHQMDVKITFFLISNESGRLNLFLLFLSRIYIHT